MPGWLRLCALYHYTALTVLWASTVDGQGISSASHAAERYALFYITVCLEPTRVHNLSVEQHLQSQASLLKVYLAIEAAGYGTELTNSGGRDSGLAG